MASGLLSLKWNNHRSTFFHVLSSIRSKESYCDATLACDGRLYPVHKLVLSTCSEYFEHIFDKTQCKHPVIVLKDIRHEELEALMNYMYVGEVNVLQDKLSGLIKAAECLKIKGLAVPDEEPLSFKETRRNQRPDFESPRPKRKKRNDFLPSDEKGRTFSSRESNIIHKEQLVEEKHGASAIKLISPHRDNSSEDKICTESSYQTSTEDSSNNASSSYLIEDSAKRLSNKQLSETDIEETSVKTEPPDIVVHDEVDIKENLHATSFEFNPSEESNSGAADDIDNGHDDDGSDFSNNVAESVKEGASQVLQPASTIQGNSFSLWDEEGGSSQNFPLEEFSAENSQPGRSLVDSSSLRRSSPFNESPLSLGNVDAINEGTSCEMDFKNHSLSKQQFPMQQHTTTTTAYQLQFFCNICTRSFATSIMFNNHLSHHDQNVTIECPTCSYSCLVSDFSQHFCRNINERVTPGRRPHTDSQSMNMKRFSCSDCSYRAFNKSNLVIHMRTHTGEKPFACSRCSYKGRHKGNLVSHLRTHDIARISCSTCGKKFLDRDELNNHSAQFHFATLSLQ